MVRGANSGSQMVFPSGTVYRLVFPVRWSTVAMESGSPPDLDASARDLETALSINRFHAPALQNATKLYQRIGYRRLADSAVLRMVP